MSFARAARRAAALALLAAAPAIRCAGDGSEHAAPTAPEAPGAPALPARAASDPSLPIVLQDPQGRTIRLADFGGKVRLFDVWATWCGPCRMGIPKLNSLYARYRGRGLVVVGISVDDDPGYVVDFEREIPLRYPNGMTNPDVESLFGEMSAIPVTFLVDRSGRVRRKFVGLVDEETLEKAIQPLL